MFAGRVVLSGVLAAACLTGSAVANAQTSDGVAAPSPSESENHSAPAQSSPEGIADVVMLKNGAMVRGIIIEKDPAGQVSLLVFGGQTRVWPMSEVQYAGPYSAMPRQSEPAPEPPAPPSSHVVVGSRSAKLTLTSLQKGLTFYVEGAPVPGAAVVDGYAQLCTAPCEVELPEGEYVFALSSGGASPMPLDEPMQVQGTMRLEGEHTSNRGKRTAGWVIFGVGVGAGTAAVAWGLATDPTVTCTVESTGYYRTETTTNCKKDSSERVVKLIAGGVLGLIGATLGLTVGTAGDSADITVTAGAPTPLRDHVSQLGSSESGRRAPVADALSGLGFVGTF